MFSFLEHIGTPHEGLTPHSGRFAYGTGKKWENRHTEWLDLAYDREKYFEAHPEECISKRTKKPCSARVATAESFGMSTGDYRKWKTIHVEGKRMEDIRRVVNKQAELEAAGKPAKVSDVAEATGLPWSTVKNYLQPGAAFRASKTRKNADDLAALLKERPYLDVSEGVEKQLHIPETQFDAVLKTLQDDGYNIYKLQVPQATNPKQKTTIMVLTDEDVTKKEVWENREKIVSPDGVVFDDYNSVLVTREKPVSIDSDRLKVVYAEEKRPDGSVGADRDGLIEIRPGLEDINLGDRLYAQVRIAVDGTHYIKGMAVYNPDLPEGIDIQFNTNKHEGTPVISENGKSVLKEMKFQENPDGTKEIDPHSPFGSNTTQWKYYDEDGNEHISPVEIVNDDKSWDKWKSTDPAQFLAKQPVDLAKKQLAITYAEKEKEYEEIMSVTNPTLRRQLLNEFADSCDSDATTLKAKAISGQTTNVLIPIPSLKEDEVYAPGYQQGDELVLIRFPHAGQFEIAQVRVNNDNEEGKKILGNQPEHAIGIHPTSATKLSGADFDGDTALTIPVKGNHIKVMDSLDGLKDFDPKEQYKKPDDMIKTGPKKDGGDGFIKGRQMGDITNLITDMTTIAASRDSIDGDDGEILGDIEKAVRHSMVVIDAEKHNLDWRKSYEDNDIAELKVKYQGARNAGGKTLFSQSQAEVDVPERKEITNPSVMTEEELERWNAGKKVYRDTGKTRITKTGKEVPKTEKASKMSLVDDAYDLTYHMNGELATTVIESVYADYANDMKRLGEKARSEYRNTGSAKLNKEAEKAYSEEVKSLNDKLYTASLNAPKERQAQLIASKNIERRVKNDPKLQRKDDKDAQDKLKKIRNREIAAARVKVDAKRNPIELTKSEWEAIDAGALTDTKISQILRYTDKKAALKLATDKKAPAMNSSKLSYARQKLDQGYTQAQVAELLGVSVGTLRRSLKQD